MQPSSRPKSQPRLFEGRYAPTMAVAMLALIPYILISTGGSLFAEQLQRDLAMSKGSESLIAAFSTAAYAYGAMVGGDLINRFTQRRLFLACESAAALAWLLAAIAPSTLVYGAGLIGAGFATGLLLVVSLPPVIRSFGVARVPLSAAFINLGLFGGVAGGPLLGGAVAAVEGWRWLFGGLALLAFVNLGLASLTLGSKPPAKPDLPFDRAALLLGLGAVLLTFAATGGVGALGLRSPIFWAGLVLGLLCLVALLVTEYRKKEPLAPIEQMANSLPVIGTLAATLGGAAFVTLLRLSSEQMRQLAPPPAVGIAFLPQLAGCLVTAALLGLVLRTRFLPLLVLGAMLVLIAGGGLLLLPGTAPASAATLAATFLLGLGAGGSVSPGLFLCGLALPSNSLGRIIAVIELVRSVGDYMLAPVMLELARAASGGGEVGADGVRLAILVTLAVAALATAAGLLLYWASGLGLPRPDLKAWLDGEKPALQSPPLFAHWRG